LPALNVYLPRQIAEPMKHALGADPEKARAFAKELIGMAPDVIVPGTN
jgi:hypothetical protein